MCMDVCVRVFLVRRYEFRECGVCVCVRVCVCGVRTRCVCVCVMAARDIKDRRELLTDSSGR